MESLITKYRPNNWKAVVGQADVVRSFLGALEEKTSHSFLLTGPSGVGKTTLARLAAYHVGTSDQNIIEVDAATFNSVDDMRALTEGLKYKPLLGSIKSLIIDECQATSRAAWQSLLKSVEEPPDWVYWFFCITDIGKVPEQIKTRCSKYLLKPVRHNELCEFLDTIVEAEQFPIGNDVIDLCVKESDGSPRKALSNLAVCAFAKDRKEAASLLVAAENTSLGAPFALAKTLADGGGWKQIKPILESLVDENPETIRQTVRAYFTSVIIKSNDENQACKALKILDNFCYEYNSLDGFSQIVIAVGRSIFS